MRYVRGADDSDVTASTKIAYWGRTRPVIRFVSLNMLTSNIRSNLAKIQLFLLIFGRHTVLMSRFCVKNSRDTRALHVTPGRSTPPGRGRGHAHASPEREATHGVTLNDLVVLIYSCTSSQIVSRFPTTARHVIVV